MNTPKTLERRSFLASTAASVVAGVAGCEATGSGVTNTDTTGTTSTTSATSSTTSPTSVTTTQSSSSTAPASSSSQTSSGVSSSDELGSSAQATSDGATSSTTVDTSSAVTSSEAPTPADDACFEGGGTDGGLSDDAGAGVLCSTNTDNGDHCHALVVPQSDATAGFAEATYTLEDGGTGHSHTVTITAYDFFYLEAGIAHSIVSTEEDGHYHVCLITCPPS